MAIRNKNFFFNGLMAVAVLTLAVLVYYCKHPKTESEYATPKVLATHFKGGQYVGSETCLECHADIYALHLKTAHHNTSAMANAENIKGSFEAGTNTLDLEYVEFIMKHRGDSFYLDTKIKNRTTKVPSQKIDIVIGSGVRGQSYLSWENDLLFQLQPSYYTPSDSWANSPGFPSHNLKRPIRDACIVCHVTFAKNENLSGLGNNYIKKEMMLGITCERCHGPSAKHVAYHRQHKDDREPKFMMDWDTLSRQRRLDACAQCHSGLRDYLSQESAFSFLVGDDLNAYSQSLQKDVTNEQLDVHGNQYGLLTSSRCFTQSAEMDCVTCHNPHKNQRGEGSYFNQKCISCHTMNAVDSLEIPKGHKMSDDCVSCHMPLTPSKAMNINLDNDSIATPFYFRTHLIGIYPEHTKF